MFQQRRGTLAGAQRFHVAVVATIMLVLAVPVAVLDTHVSEDIVRIPLTYDRFLNVVRALTPPGARLLTFDTYTDPEHHLFERSRYVLYPRTVVNRRVPQSWVRGDILRLSWAAALREARSRHAQYLMVWARPVGTTDQATLDRWGWSLPSPPYGALPAGDLRARVSWGWLVRVGT
jgi:hypothetical protein